MSSSLVTSRYRIDPTTLYFKEYNKRSTTTNVPGFEMDILLPEKPPKRLFKNYGKPKDEQLFEREHIPEDLRHWPKREIREFVSAMWHKRRNGEWWLIGGQEIYLTGAAWTFFNFWHTTKGPLPDFRMEAVDFFLVWEHCFNDPDCFGLLDIKPRRIGDTEKTLFLMWEHCSGTRYQRGGMQNVKDDAAQKNFKRLVRSNNKMIWFFKPMIKGSDNPSKVLEFTYPEKKLTRKKLKAASRRKGGAANLLESKYKYPPIESSIDYEASVQGKYDGEQLGFYHLDEPGKILAFNIKEQWPVIRRTLSLENDRVIVGKAIFTTTVEDYQKGSKSGESVSTLKNVEYFYKNSNPKKRDGNNRTLTGLYRYFRSAVLSDKPDKFGFYDEKRTKEWIYNLRQGYEEAGDWEGLAQVKRQYPLNIQDVFSLPIDECVLMPVLLDKRLQVIEEGRNWDGSLPEGGKPNAPKEVQGDLVWVRGQFGVSVEFVPSASGKWRISQFPVRPNYKRNEKGRILPGNNSIYTFGCDPYDHMIEGKAGEDGSPIHSEGAGVIYRRYDADAERNLKRDEEGEILDSEVHKMQTDKFVCFYLGRPQDPTDFYDDMLKMSVYYGVGMFFEKDKPGVATYFRNVEMPNGQSFSGWLKNRPKETKSDFGRKKNEKGAKATAGVVQLYTDSLKWHVLHRIHTYEHPGILEDFRKYKVHNRTECDLTVACGFALLAAGTMMKKRVTAMEQRHEKKVDWFRKHQRR